MVREGARAREDEDALMWLSDAGEILRTYYVTKPDVPLKAYADLKSFKVFLLDVGLLRCLSGLSPKVILEGSRIFEEFKGAITEQYVLQELNTIPHLQSNYYWTQVSEVTKPPPVGADPCVCPTPKGVPQRLNRWKYVVPTLGGHMGPPLQSGGLSTCET